MAQVPAFSMNWGILTLKANSPALVRGLEPKAPAKKRRMTRVSIFWDPAAPALKAVMTPYVMKNSSCRPYISESGAQRRGPIANWIFISSYGSLRDGDTPYSNNEEGYAEHSDLFATIECTYNLSYAAGIGR